MNREKITKSIEKGLNFIIRAITPSGFWQTFQSSQGESDVWISAYIIREIGILLPDEQIISRLSNLLLYAQANDGGWGYKRSFVSDADSTATVCLSLHQLGKQFFPDKARAGALQFLLNHLDTWDTGFRTFRFDALRKILPLDKPAQAQGWIEPHVDVSANVCEAIAKIGNVTLRNSCKNLFYSLLAKSTEVDSWEAYWWSTDSICTYHMIRLMQTLLLSDNLDLLDAQIGKIAREMSMDDFLKSRFPLGSCIFTTSIGIRCLINQFERHFEQIFNAINVIISLQYDDGSWDSQPILVIPTPCALRKKDVSDWKIDAPGYPNVLSDKSRVLVTAVAVRTLHEIYQALQCSSKKAYKEGSK